MSESVDQLCAAFEADTPARQQAAEEIWDALLGAAAFVEGIFKFAGGDGATLKVEADRLYKHPRQYDVVISHILSFPCVQQADVISYVPKGWEEAMVRVAHELGKPVAHVRKVPSKIPYKFAFKTPADRDLARSAQLTAIGEDVVSTLGSVAGVRRLWLPRQHVHSVGVLLRGVVKPDYQAGLTDHYLLRRYIPKDKNQFWDSVLNDTKPPGPNTELDDKLDN